MKYKSVMKYEKIEKIKNYEEIINRIENALTQMEYIKYTRKIEYNADYIYPMFLMSKKLARIYANKVFLLEEELNDACTRINNLKEEYKIYKKLVGDKDE